MDYELVDVLEYDGMKIEVFRATDGSFVASFKINDTIFMSQHFSTREEAVDFAKNTNNYGPDDPDDLDELEEYYHEEEEK